MEHTRLAILILAHKNQEQLIRLINHLKTDFSLFVHIDKKSKFKIIAENNVNLIKTFKVYWGTYSQIIATRELIKIAALQNYDRYLLISGQDLPLLSNQAIIKYFTGNNNNYLHGEKLPASFWRDLPEGGLERMRYYYFNAYRYKNILKKTVQLLEWFLYWLQNYLNCHRKTSHNLYGGSNWFNLTHEAVMICLENMYDRKFMNMFKNTQCADEIITQSILYNSKLSSSIINDNLRFVDWSKGGANPKVLKLEDFNNIVSSGKLFARKFDSEIDEAVIEKIYKHINES